MSIRQLPSADELEIAESKNSLVDLFYDTTAQVMTTRVGNYIYQRIDTCLSIVEKTAKWSLPSPSEEDPSKMNISPPPLIRPLPWIFFLPALIALRLVRTSLSLIALFIGKQPVYPVTMVSYLQSRRRKLRALKYRGQKIQRIKRAEKEAEEKSEAPVGQSWLQKVALPYMVWLKTPRTAINPKEGHHHHHHHRHRQARDLNKKATKKVRAKSRDEPESGKKRERDASESESLTDATLMEMIEKYANDAEDSSYQVNDTALSGSDSFQTGSDQSATESADSSEEKDTKIPKKDSNGHARSPEKALTASRKSEEPKNRASLNVAVSNEQSGEKAKPTVAAEEAGNGKLSSKNEPKESQSKTKSEPIENLDAKLASLLGSAKALSPEDPTKEPVPSTSKNPPPASTKVVKTNTQQKNVQQQQQSQQQQPNQKNQQQQPQQSSTANGGGKKHKKPQQQLL